MGACTIKQLALACILVSEICTDLTILLNSQKSSVAISSSGCQLDADLMMCLSLRPVPSCTRPVAINTTPSHKWI